MMSLALGETGTASLVVERKHLASALIETAEDDFPDVLATVAMIGLMELAGSRVMHKLLQPGELSVGVTVDVGHTAPTPLGDTVTATAKFIGMDGKFYLFEVIATDSGGEIGRGMHKRAVVSKERLLQGAAKRRTT